MKKLLFLINIHSGRGGIRHHLLDILDLFNKQGYVVEVHTTQGPREATAYVSSHGADYDRIVFSGGDGTLNEVVSGLITLDRKVPIGYIPAGSTNDFGRSLHIPTKKLQAAEIAIGDRLFSCDVGRFNERNFVYIAAFGVFTDVSFDTPQEMKNLLGHTAYLLRAMQSLTEIKPIDMRIEYDQGVIEDRFIYGMITNSRSVGGVVKLENERILLGDGLFEVTLIRMPENPAEMTEVLISLSSKDDSNSRLIRRFQTDRLKCISKEETIWTIDGENGGQHFEVDLENIQHAISIAVPEEDI